MPTTRTPKPSQVGATLKRLRLAHKPPITQEAVAQAAGTTGAYMAKVEAGARGLAIERIPAIAKLLGVDPHALMTNAQLKHVKSMSALAK